MVAVFPVLVVLLAGIGLAVQSPTNAALARAGSSVVLASLLSFLLGSTVLLVAWLAADRTSPAALKGAPAWMWLGGLYGAGFVAAMAYATPRLGLAATLTLAVASQLAAALVIDHYGLLGLRQAPLSPARAGGVVLVLAGVLLVRRG